MLRRGLRPGVLLGILWRGLEVMAFDSGAVLKRLGCILKTTLGSADKSILAGFSGSFLKANNTVERIAFSNSSRSSVKAAMEVDISKVGSLAADCESQLRVLWSILFFLMSFSVHNSYSSQGH